MKLSRRQHGVADYLFAAAELALPRFLPAGAAARRLLRGSGVNALALGALTRYELGVVRVLPMRAHLALDGLFAATFVAAPALLRKEKASVRGALLALGLSGGVVAALTDPDR